jgi:myo-inositol-1(or 4)-monophosphatase
MSPEGSAGISTGLGARAHREPELRKAAAPNDRLPIDGKALVRLAKRGGVIGLKHFRRVKAERHADRSLVTHADREIEEVIREGALRLAPKGLVVLGEEFGLDGDSDADWVLAVDPIDGTSAYVAGLPTWSVSIGLLLKGKPVAGVVYLPAFDDLYLAVQGVLSWNGEAVPRGGLEPRSDGFILAFSEFHRRHLLRFRGKLRALGSTAYHLCLVARGAAEGAILGRPQLWDVAAGAALLEAVGAEMVYLSSGRPVDLSTLQPGKRASDDIVATRAGATTRVLARIRKR